MLHAESLKQAPKSVRFKERLASTVGLNVRSTTPNKHAITDSQSPTTPINEHKSKSIKKPKTFDECFKNAVDFAQNAKRDYAEKANKRGNYRLIDSNGNGLGRQTLEENDPGTLPKLQKNRREKLNDLHLFRSIRDSFKRKQDSVNDYLPNYQGFSNDRSNAGVYAAMGGAFTNYIAVDQTGAGGSVGSAGVNIPLQAMFLWDSGNAWSAALGNYATRRGALRDLMMFVDGASVYYEYLQNLKAGKALKPEELENAKKYSLHYLKFIDATHKIPELNKVAKLEQKRKGAMLGRDGVTEPIDIARSITKSAVGIAAENAHTQVQNHLNTAAHAVSTALSGNDLAQKSIAQAIEQSVQHTVKALGDSNTSLLQLQSTIQDTLQQAINQHAGDAITSSLQQASQQVAQQLALTITSTALLLAGGVASLFYTGFHIAQGLKEKELVKEILKMIEAKKDALWELKFDQSETQDKLNQYRSIILPSLDKLESYAGHMNIYADIRIGQAVIGGLATGLAVGAFSALKFSAIGLPVAAGATAALAVTGPVAIGVLTAASLVYLGNIVYKCRQHWTVEHTDKWSQRAALNIIQTHSTKQLKDLFNSGKTIEVKLPRGEHTENGFADVRTRHIKLNENPYILLHLITLELLELGKTKDPVQQNFIKQFLLANGLDEGSISALQDLLKNPSFQNNSVVQQQALIKQILSPYLGFHYRPEPEILTSVWMDQFYESRERVGKVEGVQANQPTQNNKSGDRNRYQKIASTSSLASLPSSNNSASDDDSNAESSDSVNTMSNTNRRNVLDSNNDSEENAKIAADFFARNDAEKFYQRIEIMQAYDQLVTKAQGGNANKGPSQEEIVSAFLALDENDAGEKALKNCLLGHANIAGLYGESVARIQANNLNNNSPRVDEIIADLKAHKLLNKFADRLESVKYPRHTRKAHRKLVDYMLAFAQSKEAKKYQATANQKKLGQLESELESVKSSLKEIKKTKSDLKTIKDAPASNGKGAEISKLEQTLRQQKQLQPSYIQKRDELNEKIKQLKKPAQKLDADLIIKQQDTHPQHLRIAEVGSKLGVALKAADYFYEYLFEKFINIPVDASTIKKTASELVKRYPSITENDLREYLADQRIRRRDNKKLSEFENLEKFMTPLIKQVEEIRYKIGLEMLLTDGFDQNQIRGIKAAVLGSNDDTSYRSSTSLSQSDRSSSQNQINDDAQRVQNALLNLTNLMDEDKENITNKLTNSHKQAVQKTFQAVDDSATAIFEAMRTYNWPLKNKQEKINPRASRPSGPQTADSHLRQPPIGNGKIIVSLQDMKDNKFVAAKKKKVLSQKELKSEHFSAIQKTSQDKAYQKKLSDAINQYYNSLPRDLRPTKEAFIARVLATVRAKLTVSTVDDEKVMHDVVPKDLGIHGTYVKVMQENAEKIQTQAKKTKVNQPVNANNQNQQPTADDLEKAHKKLAKAGKLKKLPQVSEKQEVAYAKFQVVSLILGNLYDNVSTRHTTNPTRLSRNAVSSRVHSTQDIGEESQVLRQKSRKPNSLHFNGSGSKITWEQSRRGRVDGGEDDSVDSSESNSTGEGSEQSGTSSASPLVGLSPRNDRRALEQEADKLFDDLTNHINNTAQVSVSGSDTSKVSSNDDSPSARNRSQPRQSRALGSQSFTRRTQPEDKSQLGDSESDAVLSPGKTSNFADSSGSSPIKQNADDFSDIHELLAQIDAASGASTSNSVTPNNARLPAKRGTRNNTVDLDSLIAESSKPTSRFGNSSGGRLNQAPNKSNRSSPSTRSNEARSSASPASNKKISSRGTVHVDTLATEKRKDALKEARQAQQQMSAQNIEKLSVYNSPYNPRGISKGKRN